MKFLGIDYGTKRIGLAISDSKGVLAFPKEILFNDNSLFKKLAHIIEDEEITGIIIGESVNFKGEPNLISKEIETFIKKLSKTFHLPVDKQKEFLTSSEVFRHDFYTRNSKTSQSSNRVKQKKIKYVDDSSAALILQRYLDKKKLEK